MSNRTKTVVYEIGNHLQVLGYRKTLDEANLFARFCRGLHENVTVTPKVRNI